MDYVMDFSLEFTSMRLVGQPDFSSLLNKGLTLTTTPILAPLDSIVL